MSTRAPDATTGKRLPKKERIRRDQRKKRMHRALTRSAVALGAVGVLAFAFFTNPQQRSPANGASGGAYPFEIGSPGPGDAAPDFTLAATDGSTFTLSDARGENVLLFFQEGLGCQPCWDNMKEIEARMDEFEALGVERMLTITTDPLGNTEEKVAAESLRFPVLADEQAEVSRTYDMPRYGMHPMSNTQPGHSFVLVNGDGEITWRADYGGAPNYTMYVPVDDMLADLRLALEE
ncbi:MAG TPA: peroxiredoxin family protein [Actinomycetota bacterium]|nr:peroxiredoxin family protein [Actinomycetota bacterium]